jgi:hypothetical protein
MQAERGTQRVRECALRIAGTLPCSGKDFPMMLGTLDSVGQQVILVG